MDTPELPGTEKNHASCVEGPVAREVEPVLLDAEANVPPSFSDAITGTTPNSSLPIDECDRILFEQLPNLEAEALWQQMGFDSVASAQPVVAGPSVPPTAQRSAMFTGEGQTYNPELDLSTTYQPYILDARSQELLRCAPPRLPSLHTKSTRSFSDYSHSQLSMGQFPSKPVNKLRTAVAIQPRTSAIGPQDHCPQPLLSRHILTPKTRKKKNEGCMGCRIRHRPCKGGMPCQECIKKFSDPGFRNVICMKLQILDIIEAGSYFGANGLTKSHEVFNSPEWRIFQKLTSFINTSPKDYFIPLSGTTPSRKSTCKISLRMVHSCLEGIPKSGKRSGTLTASKVMDNIKDRVKLPLFGQFVRLDMPASSSEQDFWMGVIRFCGTNSYTSDLKAGIAETWIKRCKESDEETLEQILSEFQDVGSEELEDLPDDVANFVKDLLNLTSEIFSKSQDGSGEFIGAVTAEIFKKAVLQEVRELYRPRVYHVGFHLSWLASRYLELCMFKYIQDCINSREKLLDSKLETVVALILRIISTTKRPVLTLGALKSKELRSRVDDFNDRQGRIRAALWVYCAKIVSNLKLNEFWSRHQNDIPILSANGLPERFWESLESFDDKHMPTPKAWSWMVQPFYHERAAVAKELDTIKQFITTTDPQGSDQAFKSMFQDMATGFIHDLVLGTLDPDPECTVLRGLRLFLALINLPWSFERLDGVGNAFRSERVHQGETNVDQIADSPTKIIRFNAYIESKIDARESLIHLYNTMVEAQSSTTLRRTMFKREVDEADLQSYDDPSIDSLHCLMMKGCCIGRRWRKLTKIAGEAIILCGSPLITQSSDSDITRIVETGSKEDFTKLCSALNADMRWVKDICGRLHGVLATLKDVFTWAYDKPEDLCEVVSEKRKETFINLQKSIQGAFNNYGASPVTLLSGELRSIGLGIPAQDIIRQLQNDGLLSSPGQKRDFEKSLSVIKKRVLRRGLHSKAELAALREPLLSGLATTELSPLKVYVEKIFDNLWF